MDIKINKNNPTINEIPAGLTWFFIGQPKTWKTSASAKWSDKGVDGTLIIDADLGADFVAGANNITVTCLNPPTRDKIVDGKRILQDGKPAVELIPPEERGYSFRSGEDRGKPMPVYSLAEVYAFLRDHWSELPYDTLVIDTIDEINKWIETAVTTEMGIPAMGDGQWGSDWARARKKNIDLVVRLQRLMKKYASTLILVSHAKQSTVTDGKVQLLPELPRGLAYAVSAKADVIGYATIDKETGLSNISFKGYDERAVGSRLRPLAQKKLLFDYETVKNEILKYKEKE